MAFQAVPDTAEIAVIYSLNAVIVQNVFYAHIVGGYLQADLQALADQVDARVSGNFKAQQPPEAIYLRTDVRGLAVINDITATQNLSSGPGTQVTSALPNQVTFSVKKTSGFTGRSARGRTYWIGIPQDKRDPVNENLLVSAYAAAVVLAIGQIRLGITALGTWTPVLVSRFLNGVARPTGITFPWTGESNVDLRMDTLRGRLPVL